MPPDPPDSGRVLVFQAQPSKAVADGEGLNDPSDFSRHRKNAQLLISRDKTGTMKTTPLPINENRKRVLIVNCYFDDMRLPVGRRTKLPQAMGPVYLAGAFSHRTCDVRLYNEMYDGPLEDEKLLTWPDMLVLTGLSNSFDRMLHLTAYARTRNSRVAVVAGGPAVRALPTLSKRYFDVACQGDVEELIDVAEEVFGKAYVEPTLYPRYDLAHWLAPWAYVESSRNCNFKCPYCSLTGENHPYQQYDLEFIRRQITSQGKNKRAVIFIDNNFYGNDRRYFLERLELIRELQKAGYIRNWSALVSGDFFTLEDNTRLAKEAGCVALFCGLESFDVDWLKSLRKVQNTLVPQVEMIRRCLEQGVLFLYGLMLDVTSRTVADLRRELEFIVNTPDIPLPSYISLISPILGTPFFYDCLREERILPNTKLRDLDTTTLSLKPLDPIAEVVKFIYDIQTMRGYTGKIMRHSALFFRTYRTLLPPLSMAVALSNATIISLQTFPELSMCFNPFRVRNHRRTHVSTTELPERLYTPAFRIDSRYEGYFKPTRLTDDAGYLAEEIEQDVLTGRATPERTACLEQNCYSDSLVSGG